jgi:hypothetical protein
MHRSLRAPTAVLAAAALAIGAGLSTPAAAADEVPVTAVTASGDDGNVPANTRDNNLSTRWSDEGDGVWIRYDLGSSTTVGSLAIAWHQGNTRTSRFDIQTSTDGTSWSNAFSGNSSGTTLQQETTAFTPRTARYVRIVGHGNTVNAWTSITEVDVFAEGGTNPPACEYPSDILNLQNWKIQLPIGDEESPDEVKQPALDTYKVSPWFVPTADCQAVQFRAAVNGVTTSGSSYPRSELREMNGSSNASWSSTSGTHTLVVDQVVLHLPNDKPHLVVGQIHDSEDDVSVFRVEGSSLYVTNGDTTHHKLVTSNLQLGTRFQVKFVVSGGQIKAYYNNTLQTTISKSFSGGYFKAGAYTQANCTNSDPCSASNYGEAKLYSVTVTHS